MAARDDIAIRVSDISKTFKLPHQRHRSIKSLFVNIFRGTRSFEKQQVLNDISFEVKKGEFFGIVGRNGSGKSTLLKLLAGIYVPDSGEIYINGKLTPFIELGVGFNMELTGRENVFLNGALLGFSRKEMEAMYDDIVAFAELENFMDQKLKNYSSGMQVRLAFSIAIQAQSDVLVLDEVLAVGDEAFQRKCYQYFAQLRRNKQTVILVTHSMEAVQRFCDRAMLIDKGHKTEIGTPLQISQLYQELNDTEGVTVNNQEKKSDEASTKYLSVRVHHKLSDNEHAFDITLKPKQKVEDPVLAIGIYRDGGEQVYRWTSDEKLPYSLDLDSHQQIKIKMDDILPVGVFTVNLYLKKKDRSIDYAIFNEIANFEVKNTSKYKYATYWRIPEKTFVNGKEVE